MPQDDAARLRPRSSRRAAGGPPPRPRRRSRARAAARAPRASRTAVGVPGAQLREVPVDDIVPNPKQPRQVFDDEALEELTHSVREFGLLQPIVVRERRGRPATSSSWASGGCAPPGRPAWTTVPAIVRDTTDDAMLRDALLENIHRAQLNPLEEAAAYQQLLEEFGATHEELASRIGRSRSQVTNTIRLLKLPVQVQTPGGGRVLSAGHARALLGLPDAEAQERWRPGSSPRACRCAPPRRRSPWPPPSSPTAKRRAAQDQRARASRTSAGRLSDMFETRVKVQIGRAKGRIVVEFGTVDDLQRIIGVMAPEITGRRPEA